MDTCWAFCLAWQEAVLIPYWVAHYRTFCERVVVYVDATTTDDTAALARAAGAEVRTFHNGGALDDTGFVAFAQAHYPEARGHAAWVCWTDADEILWHPRGVGPRLAALREAGVTLPVVQGFQMVAAAPPRGPRPIWEQITRGLPAPEYDKPCVLHPGLALEWTPGKHSYAVTGPTPALRDDGSDPLRLLHYRYLGAAWHRERNARNFARIPDRERARGHGREVAPSWPGAYSPQWYAAHVDEAQEVVSVP